MTKKIYDNRVYQATVIARKTGEIVDNNTKWYSFNQTIFYPEGGGQNADRGSINGIEVIDVQKKNGDIFHQLATELQDEEVTMELDMATRLDHMQQHCAEHILSGLLFNEFGLKNVGFHMNADVVTIDINQRDFKGDDLILLEQMANRVVQNNLPVIVSYYHTLESEEGLGLRKHLSVNEDVRIVTIPGVDSVACGGTHPERTGDVGLIKILKTENNKKGSRLTFVAGNRATKLMRKIYSQWQETAQFLSTDHKGYKEAFSKMLAKQEEMALEIKNKNGLIVDLMHKTKPISTFEVLNGQESIDLKEMLAEKRFESGTEIVLIIDQKDLRFALTHKGAIAQEDIEKLKGLMKEFNGKGGGNAKKFQGKFTSDDELKAFEQAVESLFKSRV